MVYIARAPGKPLIVNRPRTRRNRIRASPAVPYLH
jgi:hypothetical protein